MADDAVRGDVRMCVPQRVDHTPQAPVLLIRELAIITTFELDPDREVVARGATAVP